MDTKQTLVLNLFFSKPAFYIGDSITGTMVFISKRPSILEKVLVEIIFEEEWKISDNPPKKNKRKICEFPLDLNNGKSLMEIQGCYMMPGGKNEIPFNFFIKGHMYPSFEYPKSTTYAFIRYHFNVKIYSSSFYKNIYDHYLCLLSRPNMELNNSLLTQMINKNVKKWNLFDIGTTVLTVSIPDYNYKYDSAIKVDIHIDNTKGKEATKESKIKFIRRIQFLENKNIKFTEEVSIYEQVISTAVSPGAQQSFVTYVPLRDNPKNFSYTKENPNPYNLQKANITYYMPTMVTPYFTCQYELRVSLYFNCFVNYNNRPRAIFPIYIVHQLPYEFQLDLQKQIEFNNALKNKEKYKDLNVGNNFNNNIKNNINNNFNNNINNNINNNLNNDNNNIMQQLVFKNDLEESIRYPSMEAIEQAHYNNINNNNNEFECAPAPNNFFNQNNNNINDNSNANDSKYNNIINDDIHDNKYNNINDDNNEYNNNNINDDKYYNNINDNNNYQNNDNINNNYQNNNDNYINEINIKEKSNNNDIIINQNDNSNNDHDRNKINNIIEDKLENNNINIINNNEQQNNMEKEINIINEENMDDSPKDFCLFGDDEKLKEINLNKNKEKSFEDINQI